MAKSNGKLLMAADAFEVATTLMGQTEIWENREQYLEEDKEEYDVCKAIFDLKKREREQGKEDGRFEVLIGLVKDGVLTIQDAAFRASVSEEYFRTKMQTCSSQM